MKSHQSDRTTPQGDANGMFPVLTFWRMGWERAFAKQLLEPAPNRNLHNIGRRQEKARRRCELAEVRFFKRWAVGRYDNLYASTTFQSREEAIAYGLDRYAGNPFYVAKCEPPTDPEDYFDADDWIEMVSCQDDYRGDHAEYWDISTPDQREELTLAVRQVMSEWLRRHQLRPEFWNAADPELITPTHTTP